MERCLQGILIKPWKELAGVCRRDWILLTDYSLMCESRDKLLKEKIQMEKELASLHGNSQHSSSPLEEQAVGSQVVGEQATVHLAKRK